MFIPVIFVHTLASPLLSARLLDLPPYEELIYCEIVEMLYGYKNMLFQKNVNSSSDSDLLHQTAKGTRLEKSYDSGLERCLSGLLFSQTSS